MKKLIPLLVAVIPYAHATDSSDDNKNRPSNSFHLPSEYINSVEEFVQNGESSLIYRMDSIYLKSNDYGNEYMGYPNYDMSTWAQSLKYSYKSPYISDHFGFDFDLYGVNPIGTQGEGFATREILKADKNGNANGFTKAPQFYLKQKFDVNDFTVKLFEGRRILKEYGGTSAEDNADGSSYNGLSSEISGDKTLFKLGYVTCYSDSDETSCNPLLTKTGKDIDNIMSIDGTYKNNGYRYRYYITESTDYMRKQELTFAKQFGTYTITAKVTDEQALDNYKAMSAAQKFFDNHATIYALDNEWNIDRTHVKLSYAYTEANRSEGGLGKFEINMAEGVQGSQDTMTSGNAHDYNNDGEHMVALSVFHDYSRDLTFGVDGRIGLGMEYQGVQLHPTEELALVGIWHPAVFPKFSLLGVVARDHTFKLGFDNKPAIVDGKSMTSTGVSYVICAQYKIF